MSYDITIHKSNIRLGDKKITSRLRCSGSDIFCGEKIIFAEDESGDINMYQNIYGCSNPQPYLVYDITEYHDKIIKIDCVQQFLFLLAESGKLYIFHFCKIYNNISRNIRYDGKIIPSHKLVLFYNDVCDFIANPYSIYAIFYDYSCRIIYQESSSIIHLYSNNCKTNKRYYFIGMYHFINI